MGQVLGTGRKVGCMFDVHDLKIHSQVVSAADATTTPSPDLWHACLGYTSLSHLQLLASHSHQVQFSFQNLVVLLIILANKQSCPLIIMSLFLPCLLILYILIFGVQHQFSLKEDLNILSYLWMIFLDIPDFIYFIIGLNLCLFTKYFIK